MIEKLYKTETVTYSEQLHLQMSLKESEKCYSAAEKKEAEGHERQNLLDIKVESLKEELANYKVGEERS